jgi:hypothetical protein
MRIGIVFTIGRLLRNPRPVRRAPTPPIVANPTIVLRYIRAEILGGDSVRKIEVQ